VAARELDHAGVELDRLLARVRERRRERPRQRAARSADVHDPARARRLGVGVA
jgi:hypothetical protein